MKRLWSDLQFVTSITALLSWRGEEGGEPLKLPYGVSPQNDQPQPTTVWYQGEDNTRNIENKKDNRGKNQENLNS